MKWTYLILIVAQFCFADIGFAQNINNFTLNQALLNGNDISTWIQNDGTFNRDIRTNNTPGMMWPKNSNKFVWFTSGLTIGTYINGNLRITSASYSGEYASGTLKYEGNTPYPYTDSTFKHYKVSEGDTYLSNPDWTNWGLMVPYGAPYTDVNQNGQYDKQIDTPGVKGASQTIFICMTDGFPQTHSQSAGFSGGTPPIYAEKRITAWVYKDCGLDDVQFIKWEIVNKDTSKWERTHFGIINDPDLGLSEDDYIGCDTILDLGYCYNADSIDGNGNPPSYGLNPPATGMLMLHTPIISRNDYKQIGMTSYTYFFGTSSGGITCEQEPSQPLEAYNYLKGIKKDGTPFIEPATFDPIKTILPGDPETFTGWSERGTDGNPNLAYVANCGGLIGQVSMSYPGSRRSIIGMGSDMLTINPLDTQKIIMAQMVARGKNHFNSVTKLKRLAIVTRSLFSHIYSDENPAKPDNPYIPQNIIPQRHYLKQNYPNPFNPVTEIKFGLAKSTNVNLTIYDITGRKVRILLNGQMDEGNYSVKFDGTGLASGIYLYKFKAFGLIQTKKMLLVK